MAKRSAVRGASGWPTWPACLQSAKRARCVRVAYVACLPAKRKASTVRPGGLRGLPACKAQSEHGASGWPTMACLRSKGRQRVRVGDKETSRTPGRQSHTTNGEEQTRKLKMGGQLQDAPPAKHQTGRTAEAQFCTTERRARPRTGSRSFSSLQKSLHYSAKSAPSNQVKIIFITMEGTILHYRATNPPSNRIKVICFDHRSRNSVLQSDECALEPRTGTRSLSSLQSHNSVLRSDESALEPG